MVNKINPVVLAIYHIFLDICVTEDPEVHRQLIGSLMCVGNYDKDRMNYLLERLKNND